MKILKKVIYVAIIIVLIILDVWIIKNFKLNKRRYGIIDKNEQTKVDFKYISIDNDDLFYNQKYLLAYKPTMAWNQRSVDSRKMVYIDIYGNEYNTEDLPYFTENRACAYSISLDKEGYIDSYENKTSAFIYDDTFDYDNGYANVVIDGKYGLIDLEGNQIIPCVYEDKIIVCDDRYKGNFFAVDVNDEFGVKKYYIILNDNNEVLAEYNYELDNLKFVKNDLSLLGSVDESSGVGIEFGTNCLAIKKDEKWGVFSKAGFKITDFIYDEFEIISSEDKFLVSIGEKEFIINENAEIIFECENEDMSVSWIENDMIRIIENGKYGIIDLYGRVIINPEYNEIDMDTLKYNYFSVQKKVNDNEKAYGIIDIKGNDIIKCSSKYKAEIKGNGEYFVTRKNATGLIILYISIIVISIVIIISLIIKIFRRKK